MDEKRNLTGISKYNKKFIQGRPKTAEELVGFLEQGAKYRSFPYLISELYQEEDMEKRLRQGLREITGDNEESIRKNVQNWIKGKSAPKNREVLFQICFILGLDEEQSSRLLGEYSENRIHYRNPGELAYAYALRKKMSYPKAVRLKEETLKIYEEETAKHKEEIQQINSLRQEKAEQGGGYPGTSKNRQEEAILYTGRTKELFDQVETEEDYFAFIRENSIYLGILHETAYAKFMELLNLLQYAGEEKYSLEQVMDEYLQMSVPQGRNVGNMSALQKLIKKCWPNETVLNRMKNRKIDVGRKTMILLYLITENYDKEVVDGEEFFYCDEEYSPEELFEIRCDQMDLYLKQFGMNTLDYGNPFDLIVLYAMHPAFSQGEESFASERLEDVLAALFEGATPEGADHEE